MIVFHGSCEIIDRPDVEHSYRNLDFGKGFYVTSFREQAERWARRKADLLNEKPVSINIQRATIQMVFQLKLFLTILLNGSTLYVAVETENAFTSSSTS